MAEFDRELIRERNDAGLRRARGQGPPRKQKGQASGPRRLAGAVLDVAAAGELLGVTEKVVRARAARGLLPWRRWGGRVLFLREELLAFMAALPGVSVQQALENVGARVVERDL